MRNYLSVLLTFALSFTAIGQNLNQNLEVHLHLNGNYSDSSGNSNNPTANYGSFVTDKFGNANSALRFNSTNSEFLFIPDNSILNAEYTMSFWAKTETNPANGNHFVVLSMGGSNKESGISITNNYSGYSGWGNYTVSQNSTYAYANGSVPTTGNWHFITSVRDNNSLSLYVDGVLQSSVNASETSIFSGNQLGVYIGKRADNTAYANITIDDIRIYSRAITNTEVQLLYSVSNVFEAVDPASHIAIYPVPSQGQITITLKDESNIETVSVYDMTGKLVFAEFIQEGNHATTYIERKGLFLVSVQSNGNVYSKKILIQ